MNWDNDPGWTERVVAKAMELDQKVVAAGSTSAIAPLFCLPIAMKGTVATVAFKSSAGVGILHDFNAVKNATIVDLIESKHGIVFGKTNVPEFAASLVTSRFSATSTCSSKRWLGRIRLSPASRRRW